MQRDATVASVVEAVRTHVMPQTRKMLDKVLEIAREFSDTWESPEQIRHHFSPT